MSWKSPVLMIGLDSAAWEVIQPLLASDQLPNLKRLMSQGTFGRLRSYIRFPSPALWTSIATGKLPEKHGVLDWYSATRLHVRCPTVYEILEGSSGDIGLFRWPVTWPPVQNAKFVVPSYIARSRETHPAELIFLNDLVFPKGLGTHVRNGLALMRHGTRVSTMGASVAELAYEMIARPERRKWWYRRRLIETALYGEVFVHLIKKHRPQFMGILYTHIDDFGHHYWKYREPELFSDVTEAESQEYGQVIDQGYLAADRAIGAILKAVPKDTLVIVLSDHGQKADPRGRARFRMDRDLISRLGFDRSVWLTELGYSTLLRPRETGSPADTLDRLQKALEQIELQVERKPVFEISRGEGPSISAKIALGSEFDLEATISLPGGQIDRLKSVLSTHGQISGHHSDFGILIMRGPGVREHHEMENASILDLVPTILALRGRPVGQDMDGRVLEDALEPSFLDEHPLQYTKSYEKAASAVQEVPFTEDELDDLESRLRTLGYL